MFIYRSPRFNLVRACTMVFFIANTYNVEAKPFNVKPASPIKLCPLCHSAKNCYPLPMIQAKSYAALSAKASLQPFNFQRRGPKPNDVVMDVKICGVCHWAARTWPAPTSKSSRMNKINEAYERGIKSDVRWRFVIDLATL